MNNNTFYIGFNNHRQYPERELSVSDLSEMWDHNINLGKNNFQHNILNELPNGVLRIMTYNVHYWTDVRENPTFDHTHKSI